MKLEYQCCSLELANRLKELGVMQESAFCWVVLHGNKYILGIEIPGSMDEKVILLPSTDSRIKYNQDFKECYAAFTVAELGSLLPVEIQFEGNQCFKIMWENGLRDLHSVAYELGEHRIKLQEFDKTEVNARAKMLIYLVEHGIVKP